MTPRLDLSELRPGSRVCITWSGGNGPHEYFVIAGKYGNLWFATATRGVTCPTLVEQVDSLESRCAKIEVLSL